MLAFLGAGAKDAALTQPRAGAPSAGGQENAVNPLAEKSVKLTLLADMIRMAGARDVNAMIDAYATAEFRSDWTAKIAPYFLGQEIQWHDFFSSAIIFGGRIAAERAVAVFYNPWSDSALVAGLDIEKGKMTGFFALAGERLRGDSLTDDDVLPSWQRRSTALAVAVGDAYERTEKGVNGLYPLRGAYELLPQALSKRLASQEEELAPVKARMIARMRMFLRIVKPQAGSREAAAMRALAPALRALKKGDKAALSALLGEKQSPEMTETIFRLPAANRARLAPNFLVSRDEGAVVALVNPEQPLWFFTAHFSGSGAGAARLDTVELYKFGLTHLLSP
jgi:hypothetical protein